MSTSEGGLDRLRRKVDTTCAGHLAKSGTNMCLSVVSMSYRDSNLMIRSTHPHKCRASCSRAWRWLA